MRYYTRSDVMNALRDKANSRRGAQRQLASEIGITPQYLNDILFGKRRLTDEIAAAIGFRKQEDRYTRITEK